MAVDKTFEDGAESVLLPYVQRIEVPFTDWKCEAMGNRT